MVQASELSYDINASALEMAQTIFGTGTQVVGASYSGSYYSSGIYSNGDALSPTTTPGDTGVILSTGQVRSFTNSWGQSNQSNSTSTNTGGANNISDFNAIAGTSTYDASYLDIQFIPDGDVMTIQFVFSSDEYPEYSASIYNDFFGVWVNGEHVPLSVTEGPTQVGGVNQSDNTNLYHSNTNDQYNTEMDGFTVSMTLTMPVNSGEVNSIRIAIADVSDSSYDSNVLIAAGSVQTALVAIEDEITLQEGASGTLDVLGNDVNMTGLTLQITHINGIAVSAGDTVTLGSGQQVTLNADGTFQIVTDSDHDTVHFTYEVAAINPAGNIAQTDIGFVSVTTIPCFVAGTMIRTAEGDVPVETLQPGTLVQTVDNGLQPLRWIGRRQVSGLGELAPVRIKAGTFGPHGCLRVSPQHRILVRDFLAEMLFGEGEVLVKAKDLVNSRSVKRAPCDRVEYVHLLFDRHEVIYSEGLATESFLPGNQTSEMFDADVLREICRIFPELNPKTGEGYGPAARRILKSYEAEVLFEELRAQVA